MRFWPFAAFAALIAVALYALIMLAKPADAQESRAPCGPTDDILKALSDKYHEGVVAMGSVNADAAVVITAAPEGKSWTLLVVKGANGCVLSSGADWLDPVMRKDQPK